MMSIRQGVSLFGILGILATVTAASARTGVTTGANVLVSREPNVAHVETTVAANPRNPLNVIGAAITVNHISPRFVNEIYVSFDGGSTWFIHHLPSFDIESSGDAQVAFGPDGTAYVASLMRDFDTPASLDEMDVFHSTDGGLTWSLPARMPESDFEKMTVDQSNGPQRGRVYIVGPGVTRKEKIYKENLILLRSDDRAQHFMKPVAIPTYGLGPKGYTGEPNAITVLRDGTIVLVYRYYNGRAKATAARGIEQMFITVSRDGGTTFTRPRHIMNIEGWSGLDWMSQGDYHLFGNAPGFVRMAADRGAGRFAGTVYLVWQAYRQNLPYLAYSYSRDLGKSWSSPLPVTPGAAGNVAQFQPAISVNPTGDVAFLWYQSPRAHRDRFDAYAAFSTDGGESIAAASRISTAASYPRGSGDIWPYLSAPNFGANRKTLSVMAESAYGQWPLGGHYIDMAAGADGVFHPFWADARNGTYQLYTAPIFAGSQPISPCTSMHVTDITKKVTATFDPVEFVASRKEYDVPIRLKNTSSQAICGPITMQLASTGLPAFKGITRVSPVVRVRVANAPNGKTGAGAAFDYSRTLGSLGYLPPHGVTNPITWRLLISDPVNLSGFAMNFTVTGASQ